MKAWPFNVRGDRAMRFELGSDSMKSFSKWLSALAALVLLCSSGDTIPNFSELGMVSPELKRYELT
jgi:hypothetical protein